MLGPCFVNNYIVFPANGTSGGMILAASDAFFVLSDFQASPGTISAEVTMRGEGMTWSVTCVYGPQSESGKLAFIGELKALSVIVKKEWLIVGDFNLITCAADKNNSNINRWLIGKLRATRDFMLLCEMRLSGRKFTWSNDQENPS
jgi:hypothetical protein